MTSEERKPDAESAAPEDLAPGDAGDLACGGGLARAEQPWWVLIVDRDEEIHRSIRFALSGYAIAGRVVEFAHAYSAAEARAILATDSDIAVVLLDADIESGDARFGLVRTLRVELGVTATRVLLRTAQPGAAPGLRFLRQFDIDDYRTRSELTRTRLATALTSAIRCYEQIRTVEASRNGLDRIARAAADLATRRNSDEFCEGALTHACALLRRAPDGLVCATGGRAACAGHASGESIVVAAAGRYRGLKERSLAAIGDLRVADAVGRTLRERCNRYERGYAALYLRGDPWRAAALFLDTAGPIGAMERRLMEVFAANISIGFDNVSLCERLQRAGTPSPGRSRFHTGAGEAAPGDDGPGPDVEMRP